MGEPLSIARIGSARPVDKAKSSEPPVSCWTSAALGYICNHARVWKATGAEIARHYRAQIAKQ